MKITGICGSRVGKYRQRKKRSSIRRIRRKGNEVSEDSMVSRDPAASEAERMADRAHNPVIVLLHIADPDYAPYCMRCTGLHRMKTVAPFLWEHECGAVHDERQVLT
jgi:hypothetical protein